MSVRRYMSATGAFLFAATTAMMFSQGARAEGAYRDSAVAAPAHHTGPTAHWKRIHRIREAGIPGATYVVRRSTLPVVEVASAEPMRSECFWCNVRVTGLGF
jgi:hypothetical protein